MRSIQIQAVSFAKSAPRWLVASLILALVSGCASTPAESEASAAVSASAAAEATSSSGLELRIEPFSDFYFLVRAQAAGIVPADPYLQPVIDAWMPVQKEIGTFGGFWRFDLPGMLSGSPTEFRSEFDDKPESLPSRAGGTIPIQTAGFAMATAMESAWPTFQKQVWPDRRKQLEEVKARLERDFMPKHRRAFAYMLRSLGIPDPEIDVPTYLAVDIHPPGATTYRTHTVPVFVASTQELLSEGRFSDLEETLLHEVCHALDLASDGDQDVFSLMRKSLEEHGVQRGDPRHHDVPHLVMFVQAEETMKRIYNADHVAYGDTRRGDIAPLYERSGEAAVIVRRVWREYLDAEIDLRAAVQRIVDQVLSNES